ncbi:hypothetical protein ACQPYK_49200 (plasmid) [Streptosporangium sp. CA-135522]|uniref:hypothetical protein n=1 Tax=Streptosporangium sp. CA-135522 TaxID=3240072 RepID=UPI003D91AC81
MIRRRSGRASGRHRDGLVPTTVTPRLWDGPARAEAERLSQAWPNWTILYGTGSRRFYAIAAWPVPEPVIVQAATSEDLEAQMHETVMTLAIPHQASAPGVSALVTPKQARRPRFPGARRRAVGPAQNPRHPYQSMP